MHNIRLYTYILPWIIFRGIVDRSHKQSANGFDTTKWIWIRPPRKYRIVPTKSHKRSRRFIIITKVYKSIEIITNVYMRIFSNELSTEVWRTCIITETFKTRRSNNIFLLKFSNNWYIRRIEEIQRKNQRKMVQTKEEIKDELRSYFWCPYFSRVFFKLYKLFFKVITLLRKRILWNYHFAWFRKSVIYKRTSRNIIVYQ